MATLSSSSFLSLHSFPFSSSSSSSPSLSFHSNPRSSTTTLKLKAARVLCGSRSSHKNRKLSIVKAVEEAQELTTGEQEQPSTSEQQQPPVVVPVSPSDTLTMFFQAEGTLNETAIPAVTKALEETEGVANLKVSIIEGLASVELKKQTTVQATGVASSLVETIQGSGFKLQTLNLSFDEEEDAAA